MSYQYFYTILQIPLHPSFEIRNFLNQLQNERSFLKNHECFHQIYQAIVGLLS